jgi:hypothetical protein
MSSLTTTPSITMRLETFGLTSAFFLSGTIFSLSHITLPSIRTTPAAHYTKLFAPMSSYGARFVPFLTVFSSTSLCYAAYISGRSQLYNAGLLVLGIFPWSAVVMRPIQNALEGYGAREESVWVDDDNRDKEAVGGLAGAADAFSRRWRLRNYIRSSFPLLGGIWALRSLVLDGRGVF